MNIGLSCPAAVRHANTPDVACGGRPERAGWGRVRRGGGPPAAGARRARGPRGRRPPPARERPPQRRRRTRPRGVPCAPGRDGGSPPPPPPSLSDLSNRPPGQLHLNGVLHRGHKDAPRPSLQHLAMCLKSHMALIYNVAIAHATDVCIGDCDLFKGGGGGVRGHLKSLCP